MNYEKWGLAKTEIVKEVRMPETNGHFFPETVIQDNSAKKYLERYINIPLRGYYRDTDNAITKKKLKKENIFLWEHNINDNLKYFFYDIPGFIKSFIGLSMCGFANNMTVKQIVSRGNGILRKIYIIIFIPIGYILYKKRNKGV